MNYSKLNEMSIDELRNLNSMIIDVIKSKKTMAGYEMKQQLYVGANVSVNHPKLKGKQCRVEKINRTKCVIKVLNGYGSYNVPLSMVELNK
jgi:hypothetical protein|tara:strand:+ start:458 stop:730 length:273 start_codon:yes stop_codon:yes gene_type:complete